MNENRTDAIGSLKAVAGKRTLPRLRLSIGRMMQIIVGLAFIFALIAISAANCRACESYERSVSPVRQ